MRHIQRSVLSVLALTACAFFSGQTHAQATVQCESHNYKYTECQAPLSAPQLVHQISSSACIINRTWGFNRATRRIWVANGCAGVFADPVGYHYGRGDRYDSGARYYDEHGHDAGKVAAGVVLGAILGAAAENADKHQHTHTTSNSYYYGSSDKRSSDYDGCHGVGCLVDKPSQARDTSQDVDYSVQKFDKDGNPNYDESGNYQGCHGAGCNVDNPDEQDGDNPSPDDDNN